jgi:hypothetical protein
MQNRPHNSIVMGARCAGAPTAKLLVRKGYRVTRHVIATACSRALIVGAFLASSPGASHAQAPGIGNEPGQPFQIQYSDVDFPIGGLVDFTLVEVPAGKRLVIEHISMLLRAFTQGSNDQVFVLASLRTSVQITPQIRFPAEHSLIVTQPSQLQGHNYFVVSQPLRLYAESGRTVQLTLLPRLGYSPPDPNDGMAIVRVAVSGYYVDVPP